MENLKLDKLEGNDQLGSTGSKEFEEVKRTFDVLDPFRKSSIPGIMVKYFADWIDFIYKKVFIIL